MSLDDECPHDDTRPWGEVTASALTFWTEQGRGVEIKRSELSPLAFVLQVDGLLTFGLPVLESREAPVRRRTVAERFAGAEGRHLDRRDRARGEASLLLEPFRPLGVPTGMHPKVVQTVGREVFGINSRGRKTVLSADPHSTIINGESREFVYPDRYPYTAVCKLKISYQPAPGAAWIDDSEATGFLIGKRTLMTSGHVQPPTNNAYRIKVIPACWAGRSVFGVGFVTYVRSRWWWNSDSGSDIQICELYDPVGERTGYFGGRGYDSDWEDGDYWTMAGYPYDRSLYAMSRETGIAVRDDDDGDDIEVDGSDYDTTQVESDADEASGASGSPLWGWWSGSPYVIGVHHGVERDGTASGTEILSCASGGDGFMAAARWGRSLWG
jgi:V8-like Glu-specific endopeptidase